MFFICPILPNRCYLLNFFYRDNHVYFELHASVFYVKDLITKEVLLSGQSNDGLYVLSESFTTSISQAFWSPCISATANLWYYHLSHPTPHILNLLVSNNKIVCTSRHSLAQCQACPLGKSSRLSLQLTGHKTTTPLDLIFSDVWGPVPMLSSYGFCLLYLSMRIPNIYGIIHLLPNLMCFSSFIVFKHLLSVSFHLRLNLLKLIGVVNIVS